jgi:hypothetical protein
MVCISLTEHDTKLSAVTQPQLPGVQSTDNVQMFVSNQHD